MEAGKHPSLERLLNVDGRPRQAWLTSRLPSTPEGSLSERNANVADRYASHRAMTPKGAFTLATIRLPCNCSSKCQTTQCPLDRAPSTERRPLPRKSRTRARGSRRG